MKHIYFIATFTLITLSVFSQNYILTAKKMGNRSDTYFVSFNALKVNDAIVVNWSTSEDVDNSHFEIQRSVDGTSWSPIALVFPPEDMANVHNYKYNDKYSSTACKYYRIRQLDFEGREKYSSVKIVEENQNESL